MSVQYHPKQYFGNLVVGNTIVKQIISLQSM